MLLLACATAARGAPQIGTLIPVDGEPRTARLVSVAPDWVAQFASVNESDAPIQPLPMSELVAWGRPAIAAGTPRLLLYDGGQLVGTLIDSDGDRVRINSPLLGSVAVPLELLRGVLVRPPRDLLRNDQLIVRLLTAPADGNSADGGADRVILENGDELTGTLVEIDANKLRLESPVGPVEIDIKGVVAIGFDPSLVAPARPAESRVLVGLRDGTCLTATRLVADAHTVRLTMAGLEPAQAGPATVDESQWLAPADSVVYLQPLDGPLEYLSHLEPTAYRHVPYLTLAWPYSVDRNVAGTLLRSGGRRYPKGISMHSTSRLTYALDAQYRRFEALAAIDDHTQGRGSVTFRVFVDGEQRYASGIVRGGMPPVPIRVDVAGGRELSLIVDFADAGDELDRANWLDARLIKNSAP